MSTSPTDAKTLLVAWTEDLSERGSQVLAEITHDGGTSWQLSVLHDPGGATVPGAPPYTGDIKGAFLPDGRPVVLYLGDDVQSTTSLGVGGEVLVHPTDRITFARSDDAGLTWAYSSVANAPAGVYFDYAGLTVDSSNGALYAVADVYSRTGPASVYAALPAGEVDTPQLKLGVWLWRSTDQGNTWNLTMLTLPDPAWQDFYPWPIAWKGSVAVATVGYPNAYTDGTQSGVRLFLSRDGGRTFVNTTVSDPQPGSVNMVYPVILDGNVSVVSTLQHNVTLSTPGHPDVRLANLPAEAYWAVADQLPDGRLGVVAQYRSVCENPAGPIVFGVDFITGTLATPLLGPLAKATTGCAATDDYGGLATAIDGTVWAAWSDPRPETPRIAIAHLVAQVVATP